MWLSQIEKWFTKHNRRGRATMADLKLTQPLATLPTLPTPERAVLYKRLVDEHHAGVRKFKSVSAFHEEYLQQGGTPRKKSVGKDRLLAGVPIGRKLNRISKKQSEVKAKAAAAGRSRIPTGPCGTSRLTLVPSKSTNNRHGMGGQASKAAAELRLARSYTTTQQLTLRVHPPGHSKGGRHYVKVDSPYPNGRGHSSGVPHPLPSWDTPEYREREREAFSQRNPGLVLTKEWHVHAAPRV
jgi:hypothetical protein